MKEHPILFSGEMVRAILEGRKTQTRRVIKPQPPTGWEWSGFLIESTNRNHKRGSAIWTDNIEAHYVACPYGHPGDRLWVREAWRPIDDDRPVSRLMYGDTIYYRSDYIGEALEGKWRPSIHMPRWASRITLEVVNVRVERVRQISAADAIAEGCPDDAPITQQWFMNLWNSINTKRGYGWDVNPWVWVIEFPKYKAATS